MNGNSPEGDPVRVLATVFSGLTTLAQRENPNLLRESTHRGSTLDLADTVLKSLEEGQPTDPMGSARLKHVQLLVAHLASKVGLQTLPKDVFVTNASDVSSAVHFNFKQEQSNP